MMTQGLDVDLPETTTKSLRQKEDPIVVTVDKNGKISLDQTEVTQKVLYQRLASYGKQDKDKPVFLKADKTVPYGVVVTIMADVKRAGFDKLGMITQPAEEEK